LLDRTTVASLAFDFDDHSQRQLRRTELANSVAIASRRSATSAAPTAGHDSSTTAPAFTAPSKIASGVNVSANRSESFAIRHHGSRPAIVQRLDWVYLGHGSAPRK
jgi:hypothetical protein